MRLVAAAAAKVLSCYLALLCLLSVCLCSGIEELKTERRALHFLDTCQIRCNFTVKVLSSRWYEVQCSANGNPFFQYKDNKVKHLGNLGMEVYCTEAWEYFAQTIKDLVEELLNMESWPDKKKGSQNLEVILVFPCKQEMLNDIIWTFTIDREYSFRFYPTNKTWNETQPEAISIMKEFQTNRVLGNHLKFSMGDFNNSLNIFLKLWKEVPRSTITAQDITQLTSANTTSPTVNGTSVSDSQHLNALWILLILPVSILIAFIIHFAMKRRKNVGAPCCSTSSAV